jgi:ABC-type branched-subunit amino acid transport system substrate-binding protein
MSGLPILVGVLHDFPAADGGEAFEWAARLGFGKVGERLPGPVEFLHRPANGLPLPGGSAKSVQDAFGELDAAGVLAVLGPAITDNALVVRPLADAAGLACLNYTGSEESRSQCAFHFQIGSLEDEPSFLAAYLARRGLRRVALLQDSSHIGRRKAEFFEQACSSYGLDLVSRAVVAVDEPEVTGAMAAARAVEPDALVCLGLWGLPRAVSVSLVHDVWDVPTIANSALMYGYHQPAWAKGWEGWIYPDTVSDTNQRYLELCKLAAAAGRTVGPGAAGAYDMGRLLAEGIARARYLMRHEVVAGLERVKSLPAATGQEGTLMGFGRWDRAALKGRFLVLRQWRDGQSRECEDQP